ncbi:hypothetical protein Q5752_004751 [Cryptotrichosporon argae]
MRAPSPPSASPILKPAALAADLQAVLRAIPNSQALVHARDHDGFQHNVIIFNGAVRSPALVLVQPGDARDVSAVVKYCTAHDLEISIKGGGYGTHGWSVAGHVILDLSAMDDIHVTLPSAAETLQASFESLSIRNAHSTDGDRPSLRGRESSPSASEAVRSKRKYQDETAPGSGGPAANDGAGVEGFSAPRRESVEAAVAMSCGGSPRACRSNYARPPGTSPTTTTLSLSDGVFNMQYPTAEEAADAAGPSSRMRVTYVNPSPTADNHASYSAIDGLYQPSGLVLNTNPDPPPYVVVTFGTGADSKKLDKVTAASTYGAFHIPTSSFPVGSGQFLTGGFGFLGRRFGLAMDNVVEAEVVLADGRVVWVGESAHGGEWRADEDPAELWWALRGAGPIFGVVTRLRVKAHYVPSVYAGNFIYRFDRDTTPSLLRHVRDCIEGSTPAFYINIILTAGPIGAPAIVVMQLCHSGARAEGEAVVSKLRAWEGPRPLFQDFSERTFERQQLAVEDVLKGGQGRKWYIKSDLLNRLSDDVIDQTCARFDVVPDGCTWLFEFTGGSVMADVRDSCYPSSHRRAEFTVAALHQWGHNETADEDMRCVTTASDWIRDVIHPNSPGGPLPCFLQSSTEQDVRGVYGANFDRLAALKRKLDPDNVFRHAMWPRPGAPGPERQVGADHPEQESVKILADGYLDEDELDREAADVGAAAAQ